MPNNEGYQTPLQTDPNICLFISDLHLAPEYTKNLKAFHHFMETIAPQSQQLYILGDFFEYWVGFDVSEQFQKSIFAQLQDYQAATPKRQVYFMPGNRDFLLGKKECLQYGVQYLQDPTLIHLDKKAVLLMHGDSLCTLDQQYQKYRRIIQSKPATFVLKHLPRKWRVGIAKKIRKKSQGSSCNKSGDIMDVNPKSVVEIMENYHVNTLIHGHTHKPAIHEINLPKTQQKAKRIVMGAWEECGSYIRYEKGRFNLVPLIPF